MGESGKQRVLVLPSHFPDPSENLFSALCQMKRIQAAVAGIRSPVQVASFFKVIQNRHQAARMDSQLACKLLLAESGGNTQQAQDAGVGRRQIKNPQSFSKLGSGMRT
jgi:hypothetical protein